MKYTVIKDSKKFYNGKQEDYSKYRPTYPTSLFEFLYKDLIVLINSNGILFI